MDAGRVLSEMSALGLEATEAGPDGFLPDDPQVLIGELAGNGLKLVGGFTPLVLHQSEGWTQSLRMTVHRFAECGADVIVLASATGGKDYDSRPTLTREEWRTLFTSLDLAAEIAAEGGLRAVLHPHVGTVVQDPEEIDRVLEGTSIPLCLDTGHVMAGGGDPSALATLAAERIGHIHLKDVSAEKAREVAAGSLTYSEAVRSGLYRPLGHGDVDLVTIVSALVSAGYEGWYVLEQDVILDDEPALESGPRLEVKESLQHLKQILAAVHAST